MLRTDRRAVGGSEQRWFCERGFGSFSYQKRQVAASSGKPCLAPGQVRTSAGSAESVFLELFLQGRFQALVGISSNSARSLHAMWGSLQSLIRMSLQGPGRALGGVPRGSPRVRNGSQRVPRGPEGVRWPPEGSEERSGSEISTSLGPQKDPFSAPKSNA